AGYLHRSAAASGLRASAALCESAAASAFSPGAAFWLFRVERAPARMHELLATTPGLDMHLPVTDNVAVAAGYRHPIPLESCRGSFPGDRLFLFSPQGVTEVAPLPVLAALEDVVRLRVPAPVSVGVASVKEVGSASVSATGRPDLAVTLRLEPSGEPCG